nr:hypothetical protein [Cytophagales bacterium]
MNPQDNKFTILTVGYDPDFIEYLLTGIEKGTGINFIHGLVGDGARIIYAKKKYPHRQFLALSKQKSDPLPEPDYELLARLESDGVPTLRNMVLGDPYLRYRSEKEAFGYATLLARSIEKAIKEYKPDVVQASFDCLHSAMSLAVAKSLDIPWVAMTYSVIPDNLTAFCNALTPDSLVPITRPVTDDLREEAKALKQKVYTGGQKVLAYTAPSSFKHWIRQYIFHANNFVRRITPSPIKGIDQYTAPTLAEGARNVLRRSINSLMLPSKHMLKIPPNGKFVYYPFHMSPESMIDTWAPFYQDQIAFIEQISRAIPIDFEFVVKLHFSDPTSYSRAQLQKLMKIPRLRVASPFVPSRPFLEQSSLVIGLTGTTNIEAALRGKPVLLFADSPYVHFPRSEKADRPDKLSTQIKRMLATPPPNEEEIVESYATYLARYMPGRINDWSRPIEPYDIKRYCECFNKLRTYVVALKN